VRHARRRTRATQAPAAGVSESLPHAAACAAPCQQPAPRRAHAAGCVRVVRHAGEGGTHTMPVCPHAVYRIRMVVRHAGEGVRASRAPQGARLTRASHAGRYTHVCPHTRIPHARIHLCPMPVYTYTYRMPTRMPVRRVHTGTRRAVRRCAAPGIAASDQGMTCQRARWVWPPAAESGGHAVGGHVCAAEAGTRLGQEALAPTQTQCNGIDTDMSRWHRFGKAARVEVCRGGP
jgi:hypothetical protein